MSGDKKFITISSVRILRTVFEYRELLRRIGIKPKPISQEDKRIIIFVIHPHPKIGTIIFEEMLTRLEGDGIPVSGNYAGYFMRSVEQAKSDPRFEKANVVLLFDHPDLSRDVDLYPELRDVWTRRPSH